MIFCGLSALFIGWMLWGCNFNRKSTRESGAQPPTDTEKSAEASSPLAGQINEEMLWKIFMKIPQDSMPEYWSFTTDEQRRLAKTNKLLKIGDGKSDNYLEYDETNENGVRNYMGVGAYLTEDGKKIIALFYYGGGVDIYGTASKQTYEYDIAGGGLKAIECPMDPLTEDEFLDAVLYSPTQLKKLQASFRSPHGNECINYAGIDRDGFELYFAVHDAFQDWDEYVAFHEAVQDYYEDYDRCVKREWNGSRFVKTEKFPPDYLITGASAGRFKMGQTIALPYSSSEDLTYKLERTERIEWIEGTEETIIEHTFLRNGDTLLIVMPMYDYDSGSHTDKIGKINIFSPKYKTKEGIGVHSTVEDFIKCYPNYSLWWGYISDRYILESKNAGERVQFILDADDCLITPKMGSGERTPLKPSDFKKDAQIKEIGIWGL